MAGAAVLVFCRWAIGLAFTGSAVGKAAAFTSFRRAIVDFDVVPARLAGPAAGIVLGAEGLVVVLIAAGGIVMTAGFALALTLLTMFSVVLAVTLRRKADVSCNCFGSSQRLVSWYDVARNGTLGLGCAGGLWGQLPAAAAGGYPPPAVILVLGLAAAALVIIAANLEDIVGLLRKPYLYE